MSQLDPVISLLQRHDLFSGIDAVRLEVLAFTCTRKSHDAGETLFSKGDAADGAFLILEGEAAMLIEDARQGRHVERLGKGDLVGEAALFRPRPWRSTMRAVTELHIMAISRDMFLRLLGEFPEMADVIAARLSHRLERAGGEIEALLSGFSGDNGSEKEE